MNARFGVIGLLLTLLGVAPARGESGGPWSPGVFRVEEERSLRESSLTGYVYSDHTYRVGNVRLRLEVLDAAGQPLDLIFGWVFGDIPAGGRAYFTMPAPPKGSTYRVTVDSFDQISRQSP